MFHVLSQPPSPLLGAAVSWHRTHCVTGCWVGLAVIGGEFTWRTGHRRQLWLTPVPATWSCYSSDSNRIPMVFETGITCFKYVMDSFLLSPLLWNSHKIRHRKHRPSPICDVFIRHVDGRYIQVLLHTGNEWFVLFIAKEIVLEACVS